jgi:hypothetical protein
VEAGDVLVALHQAPEGDPGREQAGVGDRFGEAGGDMGEKTGARLRSGGGHRGFECGGDPRVDMGIGRGDQRVDAVEIMTEQSG